MTVGLCGSHRVGKTTLAEAFSNHSGLPLILTNVSAIVKALGVDVAKPMSFANRIDLQNAILDGLTLQWREEGAFVTDRTPIDLLAYTTADITMDVAASTEDWIKYDNYARRCFHATNEHFSTLVVVQPGIPIVEAVDKATGAINKAYMEHLNALAVGLAMDSRVEAYRCQINRNVLKLDARIEAVEKAWYRSLELSGMVGKERIGTVH